MIVRAAIMGMTAGTVSGSSEDYGKWQLMENVQPAATIMEGATAIGDGSWRQQWQLLQLSTAIMEIAAVCDSGNYGSGVGNCGGSNNGNESSL